MRTHLTHSSFLSFLCLISSCISNLRRNVLFYECIFRCIYLSELRKQVRSHVRKYEKSKDREVVKALFRIQNLRLYFADLSSECRLAKLYGFDVKLGVHPDLTINGKNIEVKRIRSKYIISKSNVVLPLASLSNPIRRGLRQNADIVAIEVNHLEKRDIKDFKTTWLARDTLKNVLETALTFNRKGSFIVLFQGTNRGYFGRIILLK